MQTQDPISLSDGVASSITFDGSAIGVLIANESPLAIKIAMAGFTRWLPAWTVDFIPVSGMQAVQGKMTIMPNNITSATNSPSNVALVTIYESGDVLTGLYPCALTRQTNIGNGAIPTTATNSVVNDGNAAGTTVVEGTPSGASGSQLLLKNDGTGLLGAGLITIDNTGKVKQTTASNGAQIDSGMLLSVPTANLSSGALPAGVTVAPSQLVGGGLSSSVTIASTAIRTGTLASGVTVPVAQLGSGDLPAGTTVPTANIDAGALPAGVTMAASQLTTGVAPTGVEIGTSATNKVSMSGLGGGSQVGIISTGNALWLASDINAGFMFGAYFNGTGYVTMSNNAKRTVQALISTDGLGGSIPYLNLRWSTGNATGSGQAVTWGNWFCVPTMADSNNTGGTHIFTGTATPSGPVTGDLWFNG